MHLKKIVERRAYRGQGLVEFALVIMLLLLVVFGVLDLGRVFFSMITITNAAREGARYGINYPGDATGIRNAAIGEAVSSGITLTSADISPTCRDPIAALPCPSGRPLRVTVSYSFQLSMGWILPSPIQLTRYVEMLVP